MLINDPTADAQIDVTGWDLDHLAELITTVRQDRLVGADRELTEDESEALGLTYAETGMPTVWTTEMHRVAEAADHWGQVIDEAIFQRDLPRAMAAHTEGRALNALEQAAWDTYLREVISRG
jgi:hypothetical protein